MAFPTAEQLTELIAPAVDGLDVEDIRVTRAGKKSVIAIHLDADDRPDLDRLEVVSKDISELLDAAEDRGDASFGAGYTLEVSTPGVDLPLTAPRHWRRNRHRLVSLGEQGTWRIGALSPDETSVVLVRTVKKDRQMRILELAEEVPAVVEIEFATTPEAETELTGLDFDQALAWREDNK